MISEFCTYLINNDANSAELLFNKSAHDLKIIEGLVVPAMSEIGELWERNEISLSQIYLSSKIVESLVNKILPGESPLRLGYPKMAIAALEDYHMMGKNIVAAIVRAAGYRIMDYGRVSKEELSRRLSEHTLDIIMISTLMLPSALDVKNITDFINKHNINTKVIVGGAPFNFDSELLDRVGADYYCEKASDIIGVIENIKESHA